MKTIRLLIAGITITVAALAQRVPQCDPGWKLKADGGCERETKQESPPPILSNESTKQKEVAPVAPVVAHLGSGPFGLHRGMTQEQVIQIVGKGAISEAKGDTLRLLRVPKSHPAFGLYSLIFSPKDGLLKIVAYGNDIRTNAFGEAIH